MQEKGKIVQVTITSGIAAFPKELSATTLHRWCRMEDGKYPLQEIVDIVKTSPAHSHILERIISTDDFMIDDVSMLSARLFDVVAGMCQMIRNKDMIFGGTQVSLAGDFYQLPSVRIQLYSDPGLLCYRSLISEQLITHKVISNQYVRQDKKQFFDIISIVAKDIEDNNVLDFITTHTNPLGI